jgi:H+/Cl- antiporter ClcA
MISYEVGIRAIYITSGYSVLSFALFAGLTIILITLSAVLTYSICPEGTGGGIGEIKTILGGVVKPVLLTRRLILAKTLGLTFAKCSRVSIGKEGPFVHLSVGTVS